MTEESRSKDITGKKKSGGVFIKRNTAIRLPLLKIKSVLNRGNYFVIILTGRAHLIVGNMILA